jgi:hypothetical protein
MSPQTPIAPIALFAYNRLDHLTRTVEALKNNELAEMSELHIYSDGARKPEDETAVKLVREYLKTISGFKTVEIHSSSANKGLAKSIIEGVTALTESHGMVIVLEDDIVTSRNFLRYMNDALHFYAHEERVFHISGYNFPIESNSPKETYFMVPATCWGWATWKRAWKHFNRETDTIISKFDRKMIRDFNLGNTNNYFQQLLLNQSGKLNTWAIFWHAAVYLNGGLSLHPVRSLCSNIGHDGSGEHCSENDIFNVILNDQPITKFETNVVESIEFRKLVERFYIRSKPPLLKRIKNRLLRILG